MDQNASEKVVKRFSAWCCCYL